MTSKQLSYFLRIPTLVIFAILFIYGFKIQVMIHLNNYYEIESGLILSSEIISGKIKTPKTNIPFERTDIKYEYRYKDQDYRSDSITYLLFLNQYEYQYHMGQHVNVYINKKHPSESVLIVGSQRERETNIIYLAIIMVFEVIIIVLLLFFGKNPISYLFKRHSNKNKIH
jgi:hypothetical protein